MQIHTYLNNAISKLKDVGIDSARLDAELLISFTLNKSRTWIHAHPEYEISVHDHNDLNIMLKRRLNHEPLAYIAGSKEFYGRNFVVNSDILVPRPESEALIELLMAIPEKDLSYIDIGTGSGILAITTALEQPSWSGTATDISKRAIKVATQNAQNLGVQKVVFKQQNLLANDTNHYDVVLANLPYVPESLRGKPDLTHEPDIALFADHDGLALYEELFQQLAARQQKPTHLLTESLETQHKALLSMAQNAHYTLLETKGLIQHFKLTTD